MIPANSYDHDFDMTLSTVTDRPEITAANSKLAASPGSPEFLKAVNIRSYDASGNTVEPNSACVVTLPYDPSDLSLKRLKPANLAIWHLDEERKFWVKQTGASITSDSVSLSVPHLSEYALMGLPDTDLNPVFASPVPFRPNVGNTARYGSWSDGIKFNQLPASGSIKIYTISGSLVRELDVISPVVQWDVKNSAGEVVASGVYLWELIVGGNRKTGRLIVIK